MFPSRDPLNRRSALHSSSLFFTAWMERFDKNSVFLLITVISSSFHTSVIEAAPGLYSPHRHSLKFVLPCGGIIWIRQVSGPTFLVSLWRLKLLRCCIERDDWISWRTRRTLSQLVLSYQQFVYLQSPGFSLSTWIQISATCWSAEVFPLTQNVRASWTSAVFLCGAFKCSFSWDVRRSHSWPPLLLVL